MKRGRISASAIVGYLVLSSVAVLGGRVLWRSVPFELASYSTWAGIFLALAALASLIRVPRWLGLRSRAQAGFLFVLGVAVTSTALLWPAPGIRRSASKHRLDDFLPEFQSVEHHEVRTSAPMARVLEAMHQVSDEDMPGANVLMRLRALAQGELAPPAVDPRPMLDSFAQPGSGFLVLDVSNPAELVYGMVCRPWADEQPPPVNTPAEFLAFAVPGYVRVAFDFRVVQREANVVEVSTETRILGNNAEAQKNFAWYWRLIYPGSAIIRRIILDAIIERAEDVAGK